MTARKVHRHVWHVRGWRASGALIDQTAERLRLGHALPEGATTFGTPPTRFVRAADQAREPAA